MACSIAGHEERPKIKNPYHKVIQSNTKASAERLGAIVLMHEENLGKGIAIKTLFAAARRLSD